MAYRTYLCLSISFSCHCTTSKIHLALCEHTLKFFLKKQGNKRLNVSVWEGFMVEKRLGTPALNTKSSTCMVLSFTFTAYDEPQREECVCHCPEATHAHTSGTLGRDTTCEAGGWSALLINWCGGAALLLPARDTQLGFMGTKGSREQYIYQRPRAGGL